MEKEKLEEEKKIDSLDATLASPEAPEEVKEPESVETEIEAKSEEEEAKATEAPAEPETPAPALDTTPVPTPEEQEEGGIAEPESDETSGSEIVKSEPEMSEPTPEAPVKEELGVTETPARMFSQDELNEITGKTRVETRNKTFQYIYDRYGVNDEAGLDELIGNAQRYDSLNEQFESEKKAWQDASAARDKELADIKEQVALMQSGIDSARYEDAKLILRGKGLEVSLDNINAELATHPEWSKKEPVSEKPFEKKEGESVSTPNEPVTKMSVLGNEPTTSSGELTEEEKAMKMFRV